VNGTQVEQIAAALKAHRKRRGFASSSEQRNGHYLRDFARWVGQRSLGEITAFDIDQGFLAEWCDEFERRNGRDPSPKTLSNLISQLRSLFNYAERFDLLVDAEGKPVRNPMAKIDSPKIRREIKDWLTPDELEQLIAVAANHGELFTVVWLSMTAMRIGEAGEVRWRDVDMTGGTILIRSGKTNAAARRIAMTSELQAHMRRHLQRQPGARLGRSGHAGLLHTPRQSNRRTTGEPHPEAARHAGGDRKAGLLPHAPPLLGNARDHADLDRGGRRAPRPRRSIDNRRPLRPRAVRPGRGRDPGSLRVMKAQLENQTIQAEMPASVVA
jgi:integrase